LIATLQITESKASVHASRKILKWIELNPIIFQVRKYTLLSD
jgi:hypothetical protein